MTTALEGRHMTRLRSTLIVLITTVAMGVASAALSATTNTASAAPAFVQKSSGVIRAGQSLNLVMPSPVGAGNATVVYAIWDNSGVATVSDTLNNSYVAAGPITRWGTSRSSQTFFALGVAAGTDTIQCHFATAITKFGRCYAHEYSGVAAFDGTSSAAGSGNASTGPVVTTSSGDLLFAGIASDNLVTSVSPGYTMRDTAGSNLTEDAFAGAPGSYTATASQNGSIWVAQIVAFTAAGTPSTTTTAGGPTTTGPTTTQPPTTTSTIPATTTSTTLPPPPPPPPVNAAWPTSVSPNRHYLLDQRGAPYMVVGDSPQALFANLSTSDAATFFANRQSHGVNATWVNLVCQTNWCRSDGSTFDGILPFTTPGDISTPNSAYFARVDALINIAASHGITVFVDPMETSTWLGFLNSNGVAKDTAFGQYLGNRYKAFPNIVWQSGNDFQTWSNSGDDAVVLAVANGIKSAGDRHLQTIELNYFRSLSTNDPNWAALVDLNGAYTYYPTYDEVLAGYNRNPTRPVFFIEGHYEAENIGPNGGEAGTPALLRRQEYWTMLAGGAGQLYGSNWWKFQAGWQANLDSPGMVQLGLMANLFATRAWYNLVPDQTHSFLTAGYGTYNASSSLMSNDYATAAVSVEGSWAAIYMPTNRTITVDLSRLSVPTTARWFDPTTGAYTLVGPFPNTGSQQFAPPGSHADGTSDWVLVLS